LSCHLPGLRGRTETAASRALVAGPTGTLRLPEGATGHVFRVPHTGRRNHSTESHHSRRAKANSKDQVGVIEQRYLTMLLIVLFMSLSLAMRAQTSTWRPVYLGMDGMVATGHYATAMSGYRMLAQGGNAVDAGVAAAFASTIVEPSRTGIGGDLFILIYLAKT